jgi:PAS domain-containing protein
MSLFGSRTRRRRRRDGSVIRRTPDQLRQQERVRRVGAMQVLACGAVAVICVALISLIWINTERTIDEQTDDALGRVEAAITTQAATLAAQAQHELQMIDQSLSVLQSAWESDPDTFNLADWRAKMPVLTDVSDDLFIANEKHLIVQDINPAAVGQGIGSAYATFANGSLEPIQSAGPQRRDNALVVGELGSGGVTRQFLMYLVRPLRKPTGWIMGASYRTSALATVFASAGLGQGGFAALIDTHRGGVQAVAGTAASRPKLDLANTPMYTDMLQRPDGGIWIGHMPIDGQDRIVAFRRVPNRDLIVAMGVMRDRAMAPAETWAAGARTLAAIASLLVLAIGATVLWEAWHWRSTRRRRRALAQAERLVATMQNDLAAARAGAAVRAAQVQAMLGGIAEGVATIDGEHHLTGWNPRFAALSNLAEGVLREGLPLDELLRQQVVAGRFGAPAGTGAEVDRLVAALRPESGSGEVAVTGPDGTGLVLRSQAMPDGGLLLILGRGDTLPAPATAEESEAADPVEW